MTPGALYGELRRRFQHGLRVAWYRDVVRQRILRTPPITDTRDHRCEIHVMTSQQDWLNLIWTLKSFYHFADRRYRLCIHDDGSLCERERVALQHHFPEARLILRGDADAAVLPTLEPFPRCLAFRTSNHLAPKVFDFAHYLQSDRLLLLDSDVLFFAEPTTLLQRIEDGDYRLNSVNADIASAYTVDPAVVKRELGFDLVERFNSGLGLIHRDSLRLDWLESFLALPGVIGHFWRIEQTLLALCSSKFGCELLPEPYDVHLGPTPSPDAAPCRHYIGAVRHLMYSEGMRRLVRGGWFAARRA